MDKAVAVLRLLLEGMSIRSVERVTGAHRDTILKLLILAGERCQRLMDEKIKNIDVADVEMDEIWGFVQKKEGHKLDRERNIDAIGTAYCFVGIERSTKLILAHHLGKRDANSTDRFVSKLAGATSSKKFTRAPHLRGTLVCLGTLYNPGHGKSLELDCCSLAKFGYQWDSRGLS